MTRKGGKLVYQNILLTKEGRVGKLTINRPPLNIINNATLQEINAALEEVKRDPQVRVLLITGAGNRAFSSGVDIQNHVGERAKVMMELYDRFFKLMLELDKPTIAVVNGIALGGGCGLVAVCDMAIASDKAVFGQPGIKLASLASTAAVFIPRLLGLKKGMEFALSGDDISAQEAERLGLVNKVVPEAELEKASLEFAQRFAEKSSAVLLWARRAIYSTYHMELREALEVAEDMTTLSLLTEDAQEGVTSFLEKRKPIWKDK